MQAIIFTDLDGTLLDHQNYSWHAAQNAINEALNRNILIVPCTSKTLAECLSIQDEVGLTGPIIFENGAGLAVPKPMNLPLPSGDKITLEDTEHFTVLGFSQSYERLCYSLNALRIDFGYNFVGFNDMSVSDVIAATGLPVESAQKAKERRHGEPFLWHGTELELEDFKRKVEALGLTMTKGGRFYHVMESASKGSTMTFLTQWLQEALGLDSPLKVIALGDSENDLPMLNAADFAVIVANPSRSPLQYPSPKKQQLLIRTEEAGPSGWNNAILQLLKTEIPHG